MRRIVSLLIALAVLDCVSVEAATTANSVVTAQTPNLGVVQFLQGTDAVGTYKTVYTGGANGSVVKGLFVTTNDPTVSHLLTCQIVRASVSYGGAAVTPALGAGFLTGVVQTNLLSPLSWVGLPLDSDGNPYLFLTAADTLRCTYATTLTTSDLINVVAISADF